MADDFRDKFLPPFRPGEKIGLRKSAFPTLTARVSTVWTEVWTAGLPIATATVVYVEPWTGGTTKARVSTVVVESWQRWTDDQVGRRTPPIFGPRQRPTWPAPRSRPAYDEFSRPYQLAPLFVDADDLFYAAATTSVQFTAPSFIPDDDQFYAPTITASYTLQPGLFSDSESFYAPSVALADQFLTPSLVTDADSFYASDLPRILLPGLVSDSETFFAPTVQPGAVTLTPSLVTDVDSFYSSSASTAQTMQASLYSDGDSFYAPNVGIISVLLPGLVASDDAIYAASVLAGAINLFPDRAIDLEAFFAPSISFYAVIAPNLVTDIFENFLPVDIARAILPGLVTDSDFFFTPLQVQGGETFLLPGLINVPDILFIPAVQRQNSQGQGGGGNQGGGVPKDVKYATSLVLAQSGLIVALGATISQTKNNINTRMMIYDNLPSGNPGALLGYTASKLGIVAGQNTYQMITPVARSVGQTIWIAMHSDANSLNWLLRNAPNGARFNNDVFADGPSDPFGATSVDNKQAPVLVIFLEAANAQLVPTFIDADDNLYTPAVIRSPYALLPPFIATDDSFFAPVPPLAVNELTPDHITSDDALHAPQVIPQPITLAPPLVPDDDSPTGPNISTVSGPDRQLFPLHLDSPDTIYSPNVIPLGGTIYPSLVVDEPDIALPPELTTYIELFPEDLDFTAHEDEVIEPIVTAIYALNPGAIPEEQDFIYTPDIAAPGIGRVLEPDLFDDSDTILSVHSGRERLFRTTILGQRGEADILGSTDDEAVR